MHLLLVERGSEPFLIEELRRGFPRAVNRVQAPGLVASAFEIEPEWPPTLAFACQFLPNVSPLRGESISLWAQALAEAVRVLPEHQPWRLHVLPRYGSGSAGENRCRLIHQAVHRLLQRQQRQRLRLLDSALRPFTPEPSLVQLLLTQPDSGFVSIAPAPLPFKWRRVIWPFPGGGIPVASDKAAPSRAFAKLLEAEQRLGCSIRPGEICVDLGAAPGSWTYVALRQGARVIAVDRSPLREDLMSDPRVSFHKGDAFRFVPEQPVDWLLCDVIAAPLRSIDLLLDWLRQRFARRFVVSIKFKGTAEYGLLARLKHALPGLCDEFFLTQLCANNNEVCAFGSGRARS
jgi:23S rRNA (cytidine2498-2'-O)-methyltransferase